MMSHQTVIVLDFGGQYNQLIARRVRECGVYCEVKPYTTPLEQLRAMEPIGFIFTGGPNSVYEAGAPKADPAIFELGVPVLGVSKDSVASHQKFAEKYQLPFILLSDPELTVLNAYGVWQEKKLYGKVSMGVVRSTYLISEEGLIEKVWPKVKPEQNAGEILEWLRKEE